MTKLIKPIFGLLVVALVLIYGCSNSVYAQYYSEGTSKFDVVIDKKIRPITDNIYYDNITKEQKIFTEKDQLDFELIIENTGNQDLYNLEVKDSLPKYFSPSLFPGKYDKDLLTIAVTIDKLAVGETKIYNIRGIVSNLPASDWANQLIKLTNKAEVYNDKVSDNDYASYFAEKRVNPVTGSESLILGTVISTAGVLTAFGLRKKARGY